MTHVVITDSSTVTLNGVSGSAVVTGPLTVDCESVTVGGTVYEGTILVSASTPVQLLRYSPGMVEVHSVVLVLFFVLGLICSRYRL